ncbi:thioredoxin-like protein [Dactylonectria estremocensis]|uniref:glutathione transferase n=1 Tax=Dactylonectria estremocensis TaxID=1079267 RepID=A0A9P9EFZ0_9HYPO|nr:thioredoxin-like protein [Dactylonectria estremocensis]
MTIKLYGALQSTCTQRVLLVLLELEVEYELSNIDMQKGEQKSANHLNLFHPFGRIPVIDDDGVRIFESRAICQYLVAKYGRGSSLVFSEHRSAADVGYFEQAASIEYSYFDPSVKSLAYEKLFKGYMGLGEPDAAEVAKFTAMLHTTLEYYEKVTSSKQYLTGDKFSLVDLYHMPWFHFLSNLKLEDEISKRSSLNAWWNQVRERKSWVTLVTILENR